MALTGCTAYFKLDENTGTSCADATGNGHNGTLAGSTAPTWATGKKNSCVSLNGTVSGGNSSYISIPDSSDWAFGTSDFAISMWFVINNTSGYVALFDSGHPQDKGVLIEYDISGTDLSIYFGSTGGRCRSTISLSLNTWHYLVIRKISNNVKIIIDNVQLSATNNNTNIQNSGQIINIGRYSGGGENLSGFVDEIAIWKGNGLTQEDLNFLYNYNNGRTFPFKKGGFIPWFNSQF